MTRSGGRELLARDSPGAAEYAGQVGQAAVPVAVGGADHRLEALADLAADAMKPRYKVALSHGYAISDSGKAWTANGPGVTATVLDTHWAHRPIASFRSEKQVRSPQQGRQQGRGNRMGVDGAIAAAEDLCAKLNNEARQ
jgi:hypothetical protein